MGYEPKWLKDIRKSKGGARVIAKHKPPRVENQGERLPDFIHEREGDYFRLDVPKPMAYVKCVQVPRSGHRMDDMTDCCDLCGMTQREMVSLDADTASRCCPTTWWYCDPLGHWGYVRVGQAVENEDGSISIDGLIENKGTGLYSTYWRGYMTGGFWVGEGVSDPTDPPEEAA